MPAEVVLASDLTLVVGDRAVRLTPSQGFTLAENLIRRSTARMVEEEISDRTAPKRRQRDAH